MTTQPDLSLIPLPAKLERRGSSFTIPDSPTICGASGILEIACRQLSKDCGLAWQKTENAGATLGFACDHSIPHEAYHLDIAPTGVMIKASGDAGHFYGIQTLRQLCSSNHRSLPCLHIEDAPRFRWRGMHLDVSRHFFDGQFVRRYIDLLAHHKLNIFHWHLTDDDGWRIELDAYPELTERTAWRGKEESLPPSYDSGDARYGGFYTKNEIKGIIAYAAERQVTIIPEIDVPGHCKPVTVCHPELLCEGEIAQFKSVQEVAENLLCAGREETFDFLATVIQEVAELFPSPYLHMGGDERPEGPWEQCPQCAKRIEDQGLKNVDALQGYFMERVRQIVSKQGKTMVGWNEITHGNKVDHSAIVTAWQDPEKGIEAARSGYPVVMAPAQHTYFDLAQGEDPDEPGLRWAGIVTLEKAYNWEPIFDSEYEEQVLGIEGCLWSETLINESRAEYMAFPRICALAEVAWTPAGRRSWAGFLARLSPGHAERLKGSGISNLGPIPPR